MTRIVLVLLALLCTTHIAMAQCGAPSYGTPTYATPYKEVVKKEVHEIVVPIAVPVVVPATVFQYLPALAPAAIPVGNASVAQVGVAASGVEVAAGGVPAAPAMPAAPAASVPAPSVAVPSTPAPMTEADIDRVVRERVEAILNERQSGDKGPPKLVLPDEVKDNLTSPPPKTPPPTAAKGSLDQQVASLLGSQSCTRCHTAGETPVKGNVTLFVKKGDQLYFQPSVPKDRIVAALTPDKSTGKPAMPPDGIAQAPASADLLRRWVATR